MPSVFLFSALLSSRSVRRSMFVSGGLGRSIQRYHVHDGFALRVWNILGFIGYVLRVPSLICSHSNVLVSLGSCGSQACIRVSSGLSVPLTINVGFQAVFTLAKFLGFTVCALRASGLYSYKLICGGFCMRVRVGGLKHVSGVVYCFE